MTLLLILYWELLGLIVAPFALVTAMALDGSIRLDGLLYGIRGDRTPYFSPERVQLLLFTLAVAFQLLTKVLQNPVELPDVPSNWIAVLGGSHVVYLGGKASRIFLGSK